MEEYNSLTHARFEPKKFNLKKFVNYNKSSWQQNRVKAQKTQIVQQKFQK